RARRAIRARLRRARPPRHQRRHQPAAARRQGQAGAGSLRPDRQPLRLVCRGAPRPGRGDLADHRTRRGVLDRGAPRRRTGGVRGYFPLVTPSTVSPIAGARRWQVSFEIATPVSGKAMPLSVSADPAPKVTVRPPSPQSTIHKIVAGATLTPLPTRSWMISNPFWWRTRPRT